jgi:hypothetical protein
MATHSGYRLYALLKATRELNEIYGSTALEELRNYTAKLLREPPYSSPSLAGSFAVVGAPSKEWVPAFAYDIDVSTKPADELVVVYEFDDPDRQREFVNLVAEIHGLHPDQAGISSVGTDIGFDTADHWCPGPASLSMFGHRADARRTIRANALRRRGLLGRHVNVVIIDEGLDKDAIPLDNWGGGLNWFRNPEDNVIVGSASRTSHGMMIARSILDLAPEAVLYDVPLIPERIESINGFFAGASSAQAVLDIILREIDARRHHPRWAGPWIFVNAWAIFDRASEHPLGDYTENAAQGGHPFINKVGDMVGTKHFDVIFAAGNCGAFCPGSRCGRLDRGPGHSIWGANALPGVITSGAVLADETWAGYSSQGPGPNVNGLAHDKPDLCAPSDFCETNDAAVRNSGTSAACAVTAGVVAALRSNRTWNQAAVSPSRLKQALTGGARLTHGPRWNNRLGHGILDAAAAMGRLPVA